MVVGSLLFGIQVSQTKAADAPPQAVHATPAAEHSEEPGNVKDAKSQEGERANDKAQGSDSGKEQLFNISEIRVRGNTLLDKVTVELAMAPFLGMNKTVKDVKAAKDALEQQLIARIGQCVLTSPTASAFDPLVWVATAETTLLEEDPPALLVK